MRERDANGEPPAVALMIEVPFAPVAVSVEWHGPASVLDRVRGQVEAAVRAEYEPRFNEYKQAVLAEIERLRRVVRGFTAAIHELRKEAGHTFEQSLQHALRLAVGLAEKLVGDTYRNDPKLLAALARRVATELAEQTDSPVVVKLHPETLAILESEGGAEVMTELVDAGTAFAPDPQVPPGAIMAEAGGIAGWWYPEQELAWLTEALWARLRHTSDQADEQIDPAS